MANTDRANGNDCGRPARKMIADKIACEKAAYETQWKLIDAVATAEVLSAARTLLHPKHYDDVVEERALSGCCGFPCCANQLDTSIKAPRYSISVSQRKVYDVEFMHRFCSQECAKNSHEYRAGLSETSLTLRGGIDGASEALAVLQLHEKVSQFRERCRADAPKQVATPAATAGSRAPLVTSNAQPSHGGRISTAGAQKATSKGEEGNGIRIKPCLSPGTCPGAGLRTSEDQDRGLLMASGIVERQGSTSCNFGTRMG
mmetsp:Transcript_732/g.1501  ORF Transcript_732/g.1501 Transcript_732/m.1501 type:complete len:259 (-) Transcript_732:407-1183(-)|eukprot:3047807-Pleurochrysis_carterae.AAC.4